MSTKKKPGVGRWIAVVVAAIVVVVGGAYVAAYFMAGDDVPQNTTIAGVRIGGMSQADAVATLESELGSKAEAAIIVKSNQESASISPSKAGLTVDYQASVAEAGAGRSWNFVHIWHVLVGGGEIEPAYHIDEAKLTDAVSQLSDSFEVSPIDATVGLNGVNVTTTQSAEGQQLDVAKTAQAVREAWMHATSVDAVMVSSAPDVTTDEATQAAATLTTALSSSVTLTTDRGDIVVTPAMIAAAAKIDAAGGTVKVSFDSDALWKALQPALTPLQLSAAKDASYTIKNGKPAVVASQVGYEVKQDDVVNATLALLGTDSGRTGSVAITVTQPKVTTDQASTLGVKEVTGEFTTQFPYAEYRNVNLTKAAASLNGTYVAPGATFSFNDTVGERTEANGYVPGYVISGDRMVKEDGGGVSQVATTTYNAYFFAGLTDVEHHPHTLYFSRYPAGREATVYYGSLDLKFKNDTPYGVVIQAYTTLAKPGGQGSVTVKIWSTKQYTVKSSDLVKSNYTTGTTKTVTASDCEAQSAAPGFTVNYSRLFYKGNTLVKSEPFTWTYSPQDEIICQ